MVLNRRAGSHHSSTVVGATGVRVTNDSTGITRGDTLQAAVRTGERFKGSIQGALWGLVARGVAGMTYDDFARNCQWALG